MKIVWQEWSVVPDSGSFGHGIHFHDRRRPPDYDLIGFVEGYRWLHEEPEEVVAFCIHPDVETSVRTINAMKKRVESLLCAKQVPQGLITGRVVAIPNA